MTYPISGVISPSLSISQQRALLPLSSGQEASNAVTFAASIAEGSMDEEEGTGDRAPRATDILAKDVSQGKQTCHQFRRMCNTEGYRNRIQRIFGARADKMLAWVFAGSPSERFASTPIYWLEHLKADFERESGLPYKRCELRTRRLMDTLTNSFNYRTKMLDAIEHVERGEAYLSLDQLVDEIQGFDSHRKKQKWLSKWRVRNPFGAASEDSSTKDAVFSGDLGRELEPSSWGLSGARPPIPDTPLSKDVPMVQCWTQQEDQWLETQIREQLESEQFLDIDTIAILFSEWRATPGALDSPPAEHRVQDLRERIAEVAHKIFPNRRVFAPCRGNQQQPCLAKVMSSAIPRPPPLVCLDGSPFVMDESSAMDVEDPPSFMSAEERLLSKLSQKTAGTLRHYRWTQDETDCLNRQIQAQMSKTGSLDIKAIIAAFRQWRSQFPALASKSERPTSAVRLQIRRLCQKESEHRIERSIFTESHTSQKPPYAQSTTQLLATRNTPSAAAQSPVSTAFSSVRPFSFIPLESLTEPPPLMSTEEQLPVQLSPETVGMRGPDDRLEIAEILAGLSKLPEKRRL